MASTTFSAITALISGASVTAEAAAASGDTCVIVGPGGGHIDFSKLILRVGASVTGTVDSVICRIEAGGSTFSSISLGDYNVTVGATADTVIIGGKDFESARFYNLSASSLILTFVSSTGTALSCAAAIEAYTLPSGFTA